MRSQTQQTGNLSAVRLIWPCYLLLLLIVGAAISGCAHRTSPTSQLTRDRATTLARQLISFEPTSIEARTDERRSRPVWVVTLRRPDQLQFAEVALDRATGEVVTIAMS